MSLKYRIRLHDRTEALLSHLEFVSQAPLDFTLPVELNSAGIVIDYSPLLARRVIAEFESNSLLIVDTQLRQFARVKNPWRFARTVEPTDPDSKRDPDRFWGTISHRQTGTVVIGREAIETESLVLSGTDFLMRIVAAANPLVPQKAADAIWRILFLASTLNRCPPA